MKQEENKRSPREFYDQEKEVIGRPDTEVEQKLILTAAGFLGRQLES